MCLLAVSGSRETQTIFLLCTGPLWHTARNILVQYAGVLLPHTETQLG